ncbi:MAG: hypothetical protein PHX07_04160 [Candidatus Marinimicrobia bacterium]|nr:hypothetical protein [Candidatus Neomarinimicrobiota bacterium]
MKKTTLLLLLFLTLISCDIFRMIFGNAVTLKGTIPPASMSKTSPAGTDSILSINDAVYVMVFYGNHYEIEGIAEGAFSIDAEAGRVLIVAFLDSAYHYIGNLFCGGLQMLPLVGLSDGENTVIDLQDLTQDGYSIIPAHDPLGNEILLGETEITFLKKMGAYYASAVKNIDTDNDGIPDILSQDQIILSSSFEMQGGIFGTDIRTAAPFDSVEKDICYSLRSEGGKNVNPEQAPIRLSGPAGEPYDSIVTWQEYYPGGGDFIASFYHYTENDSHMFSQISSATPFRFGTYTITIGSHSVRTLEYASAGADAFLLIAVPTIRCNAEGRLTSIDVQYRFPDGRPVDPDLLITDISFEFENTEPGDNARMFNIGELYDLKGAREGMDFHSVSVFPARDITGLFRINVRYTDLLGNGYSAVWYNEAGQ